MDSRICRRILSDMLLLRLSRNRVYQRKYCLSPIPAPRLSDGLPWRNRRSGATGDFLHRRLQIQLLPAHEQDLPKSFVFLPESIYRRAGKHEVFEDNSSA